MASLSKANNAVFARIGWSKLIDTEQKSADIHEIALSHTQKEGHIVHATAMYDRHGWREVQILHDCMDAGGTATHGAVAEEQKYALYVL